MTTTVDTNTLLVNDAAISTLAKMREQVVAATEFWKHPKHDDDGYALKMAVSLGRQLAMMMESGWGRDVKVFRDGELSLYITTPTIVYGMIFHPHGRPDAPKDDDVRIFFGTAPVLGRYCMGRQNRGMRGTEPCLKPYYAGQPTCDPGSLSHPDEAMPASAPVLGEWSFHS